MRFPTISTIIPTYNGSAFLRQTLDSVLAQGFRSTEVIVVDDASTDGTADLVRSYGSAVRLVRHETGRGTAAARNTGVRASTGDWIALLDHDDLWTADRLAVQVERLGADPAVDVWFAAVRFFDSTDGRVLDQYFPGEAPDVHDVLGHRVLTVQTLLVRRAALDAVGPFDESLRGTDDWDVCVRLADRFRLRGIDRVLAEVRIHPGQQGADPRRMFDNAMRVLAKHGGGRLHGRCAACRRALRHTRRVLRADHYTRLATAAGAAWARGNFATALGLRATALIRYPRALWRLPRRLGQLIRHRRMAGHVQPSGAGTHDRVVHP